ncbi:MAG: RNA polymerase sigma factor [Acidobacteriota bacterium]
MDRSLRDFAGERGSLLACTGPQRYDNPALRQPDASRNPGPIMEEKSTASAHDMVRRIAAGDHAAEAELVETYGQRLSFLLRRWTRDEDAAQELYQETFRRAIEKLRAGELREPERLASYLVGLAKNLSTYHYRKGDRRAVHHEDAGEKADFADPSSGSLTRVLSREKADLARRVLAELPTERDREVLSRFYLAGDDSKTICTELELAATHFKRVLFRARQRYKTLFEARMGRLDTA